MFQWVKHSLCLAKKKILNHYQIEEEIHHTLEEIWTALSALCLPVLIHLRYLRHTGFNRHQFTKKQVLFNVWDYLSSLFFSSFFLDFFQFSQKSCSVIIITVFQVLVFIIFLIVTNGRQESACSFNFTKNSLGFPAKATICFWLISEVIG